MAYDYESALEEYQIAREYRDNWAGQYNDMEAAERQLAEAQADLIGFASQHQQLDQEPGDLDWLLSMVNIFNARSVAALRAMPEDARLAAMRRELDTIRAMSERMSLAEFRRRQHQQVTDERSQPDPEDRPTGVDSYTVGSL